jgi:hypothetical protein
VKGVICWSAPTVDTRIGIARTLMDAEIISFHPPKSELILLYEVVDEDGKAEWGGNS